MKHLSIFLLYVSVFYFVAIIGSHLYAQSDRPNVIVIMTDDQGNNLGYLGHPYVKTPHIDAFANDAVQLTNFHQALMCTPSRASLMTGRYALRTRAWRTSVGRSHMPTEEVTIAEVFKANGYVTGQFGKWHLGDDWPFRAIDQGFDERVGFKCGAISQISDFWGNDYFDDTYYHNGVPQEYEGYCTNVFFGETIRFITENKDRPFMIYLAPNVTHLPQIVGEEYSKPFLDMGLTKNEANYYGMITNLDENMGDLMAALEEQGVLDNTIVVYTTDDGVAGWAKQLNKEEFVNEGDFNNGQRGGKGSTYEGGHHLFSLIRWPNGQLNGAKKVDELVSVMDIFPTLADLCGVSIAEELDQDGISFKPALYGNQLEGNNDRTLFLTKMVPAQPNDFKRNKLCVVEGDWRLINQKYLYNVKNDPEQRHDVAADNPSIVSELKAKMEQFLAANASNREVPVRFILGDERAPKISLTTQDIWGVSVFSQSQVSQLNKGKGPWKVTFVRGGRYRVTLSRYPLYTNMAFNEKTHRKSPEFTANKARLRVGEQIFEEDIQGADTHVIFEVNIKPSDVDLEAWISSEEGISVPAYYVDVEFVE